MTPSADTHRAQTRPAPRDEAARYDVLRQGLAICRLIRARPHTLYELADALEVHTLTVRRLLAALRRADVPIREALRGATRTKEYALPKGCRL